MPQVQGILLLDKPIGLTSNAALQRAKHLFKIKKGQIKAGHTGSLDPIASGVLPICFGEGTKLSQFLLESDKSYYVVAKLGEQTTTGDSEGEVIQSNPIINITEERVKTVMSKYLGEIDQIPPMFSAIKFKGKPLYELARRGIEVERQPRRVTIFSLRLEAVEETQIIFHMHCSKGTYVRTLVEEIGKDLGCGAHVIGLRRTHVSPYQGASIYTLSALEEMTETGRHEDLLACLLPIETAVQSFPALILPVATAFYLRTGQSVRTILPFEANTANVFVRLYDESGQFLGVGETTSDGRVKPYRLIAS
jgi:tRNA pseudouridine55 synthase